MTLCAECTRPAVKDQSRCEKCQHDAVINAAGWDETEAERQRNRGIAEVHTQYQWIQNRGKPKSTRGGRQR